MRQKIFIKQTCRAFLLYFICLTIAVAVDLIFFKVKNMYYTPALVGYLFGLGLFRANPKDQTIWSCYLPWSLHVHFLLCLWSLCPNLSSKFAGWPWR